MEINEQDIKVGDTLLVAKHSSVYVIYVLGFTEKSIKCSREKKKIKKNIYHNHNKTTYEHIFEVYTCNTDKTKHNNIFYLPKSAFDYVYRNYFLLKRENNG